MSTSDSEMPLFDLIVIGGGSGGIATANRAASYGAKVALIEAKALGGTCVNLGCVPKKMMWCAASIAETIKEAPAYGFEGLPTSPKFNWAQFKTNRDSYIKRLNGIYKGNLEKNGVTLFNGWGKLLGNQQVSVSTAEDKEVRIKGKNILIATGSHGIIPKDVPGADLGSTSDSFFAYEQQPKSVAVIGGGYIGVELSGVLTGLGTKVSLFTRKCGVLTHFDSLLQATCTENLDHSDVDLVCETSISKVTRMDDGLYIDFIHNGVPKVKGPYDSLIWSVGRGASTDGIGLEISGVPMTRFGAIEVDEYQNVKGVPGLLAVGDVTGVHMLTPVAIAAGRKLADRLFGGKPDSKQDFENIPTVVFAHPPCGSLGMTEDEARAKFGSDQVKIYQSTFNDLYYAPMPLLAEAGDLPYHKVPTKHKLVCAGPEERIVGLHIIGRGSDEILQGFGVAVKMGATKADFDRCVAIHPTAAEELVTMK